MSVLEAGQVAGGDALETGESVRGLRPGGPALGAGSLPGTGSLTAGAGTDRLDGLAGGGPIPVRDLEVAELRAFCAAATRGSLGEAARAMHVSQPAMSKRMRALEAVVGTELFERSSRGVTLTPAGAELYRAARRLLRSADSVQALIKDSGVWLPVRIASSPTMAELRLPQVLSELTEYDSRVAVELISANTGLVRELVHDGRADLGIAGLDPYAFHTDGLAERIVWRDELVLALPEGHPWTALEEVPPDVFASTPVVQRDPWSNANRIVDSTLDRCGVDRVRPLTVIGSASAVMAKARSTGTPALVSLLAVRANPELKMETRRVEGLRFGLEYGLVWVGSLHDLSAEVQLVANHIMQLPFARLPVV